MISLLKGKCQPLYKKLSNGKEHLFCFYHSKDDPECLVKPDADFLDEEKIKSLEENGFDIIQY